MRYIGQQTYGEIAEGLSITQGAAHQRVSTAKRHLRKYFARADAEAECLDILYSQRMVAPASLPIAAPVLAELTSRAQQESHPTNALTPRILVSSLLGSAVAVVAAGLLYGYIGQHDDVGQAPGTATAMAVDVAIYRPDAGFRPVDQETRTLVRPGDDALGWRAWKPAQEPALPQWTTAHMGSPPRGAVTHSNNGVYREFEPATGEVTCEVWIKAAPPGFDNYLFLMSDGERLWHDGVSLHKQATSEWWHHGNASHQDPADYRGTMYYNAAAWSPIAPVVPSGQRIRITHRTAVGRYDVHIDGELVAHDVPAPKTRGKAVTGVWINSSAGNPAHSPPTYFDDLRVTVRPMRRGPPDIFASTTGS